MDKFRHWLVLFRNKTAGPSWEQKGTVIGRGGEGCKKGLKKSQMESLKKDVGEHGHLKGVVYFARECPILNHAIFDSKNLIWGGVREAQAGYKRTDRAKHLKSS